MFTLHGHKLFGLWELVRIAKPGDKQEAWLLFKKRDKHARPRSEYDVVTALPDSVIAKPLKAAPAVAAGPTGAVKGPMPATLAPQLASLASAAPTSGAWSWEIKLDGYRLMARIEDGHVRLITRGGHDWSAKMPALVKALQQPEAADAPGSTARSSCWARTARRSSTRCRTPSTARAPTASTTSCSTCPTSKATTCAPRRWCSGGNC